jgi:5-methyltetrahydrofolate--homocysteine methyltransferase
MSMDELKRLKEWIYSGNFEEAVKFTKAEIANGTSWSEILETGLIPAMDRIGQDFSAGKAYLPELIAAGDAMSKACEAMKAQIPSSALGKAGTIVLGTIFGDVHDIGKNIVKMNMEGAGFKVIDLGTDVRPEAFAAACREKRADLVGISALLSSTMLNMETVIKKLREEGLRVKILVGGAPLTPEFASRFGADGYAPDGYLAVRKAKELLGKK